MAASGVKKPVVNLNLASKMRMEKAHPLHKMMKEVELLEASLLSRTVDNSFTIPKNKPYVPRATLMSKSFRKTSNTSTLAENFQKPNEKIVPKRNILSNSNKIGGKNILNTSKNVGYNLFKPPECSSVTKKTSNEPKKNLTDFPKKLGETKNYIKSNINNIRISSNSAKSGINSAKVGQNLMERFKNDRSSKSLVRNIPTQNKSNLTQNKVNLAQNKVNLVQNKVNLSQNRPNPVQIKSNNPKTAPKNPRRSLTAVHFNRIKTNDLNSFKTFSRVDIKSPIVEESQFLKRRSNSFSSPSNNRKSIFTPPLQNTCTSASELQTRLNSWLEQRGKPLGSFHHLRCFGAQTLPTVEEYLEEDKENIEVIIHRNDSYEDLKIVNPQNTESTDLFSIAKDALYDLHKLILEGYPRDSCESWLQHIKSRFPQLEDQPQYWECRAALEEIRGDFSSAVDCYKTAIIKGAEVKKVDDSLDHLLQKFSVLNLSPEKKVADKNDKNKRKTVLDARNVFKSSIINFAIQERTLKKTKENSSEVFKFVATPVRRSTRLSRSNFTSTPGVKVCPTLTDLDESLKQSMVFKCNKALPA